MSEGGLNNVGVLDLTQYTEEGLAGLRVNNAGVIIVPQSLTAAFAHVKINNTGSVLVVPDGARVVSRTGEARVSGDFLANTAGSVEDVLVIMGRLVVTSAVPGIGFGAIVVIGQALGPRSMETAFSSVRSTVVGEMSVYPDGALFCPDRITVGFLSRLVQPTPLVIESECVLAPEVSAQLLREKVAEIMVLDTLAVSPALEDVVRELMVKGPGKLTYATGGTRQVMSHLQISRAYLEEVSEPISLEILGHCEIRPDVEPDLLRSKIADIRLLGSLTVPPALEGVVASLISEHLGSLDVTQGEQLSGLQ